MIAVTLFFKVILLQGDDGVDLPELTIIQLGFDALAFDGYESRFVMRSCSDERSSRLDLPKLISLKTTESSSYSLREAMNVVLESATGRKSSTLDMPSLTDIYLPNAFRDVSSKQIESMC